MVINIHGGTFPFWIWSQHWRWKIDVDIIGNMKTKEPQSLTESKNKTKVDRGEVPSKNVFYRVVILINGKICTMKGCQQKKCSRQEICFFKFNWNFMARGTQLDYYSTKYKLKLSQSDLKIRHFLYKSKQFFYKVQNIDNNSPWMWEILVC